MTTNNEPFEWRCPTCGMPREDWPDDDPGGYMKDGTAHCSKGCAEGTGCTCAKRREPATVEHKSPRTGQALDAPGAGDTNAADGSAATEYAESRDAPGGRAPTQEEIRDDPASGAFVQSLQRETKTIGPEDYGTEKVTQPAPNDQGIA